MGVVSPDRWPLQGALLLGTGSAISRVQAHISAPHPSLRADSLGALASNSC